MDRKAAEEEGRVEHPVREPARDLAVNVRAAHGVLRVRPVETWLTRAGASGMLSSKALLPAPRHTVAEHRRYWGAT